MRVLVYDTTSGNACEVTPLLVGGAADVVVVTHAAKVRPGFEGANRIIHAPIVTTSAIQSGTTPNESPSFLRRLFARISRKRVERDRVRHLATIIAEHKPNIIIAMDAELGLPIALRAALAAAKTLGTTPTPVVCNTKGSDVLVVPKRNDAQRQFVANALRQCVGALCYTEPHANAVVALVAPSPPIPIWKIPATRDLSQFSPNNEIRMAALNSGLAPLVLCLRGTTPVYRPEVMLEAAAIASRTCKLRLRFMATEADADHWRKAWQSFGGEATALELLTTRLPHSAMSAQYAEATVVSQALLNESLGFTGVEAMACGRVMVQPGSEVAREILNPAQHGLLSGADAASLAERLVFAIVSVSERQRLEVENRTYAVARFDERVVIPTSGAALVAWLSEQLERVG